MTTASTTRSRRVRETRRTGPGTVLLDTNVLMDAVLGRSPWDVEAALVLTAIEVGKVRGAVSVHALSTLDYFARKELGAVGSRDAIAKLVSFVDVAPVGSADVRYALSLPLSDFEDALHAAAAHAVDADAIVTRDVPGFKRSPIPGLTPGDLLAALHKS